MYFSVPTSSANCTCRTPSPRRFGLLARASHVVHGRNRYLCSCNVNCPRGADDAILSNLTFPLCKAALSACVCDNAEDLFRLAVLTALPRSIFRHRARKYLSLTYTPARLLAYMSTSSYLSSPGRPISSSTSLNYLFFSIPAQGAKVPLSLSYGSM